jgi:hypothetical protein
MPQSARIRPALTEPIFESTKRMSRTLAVRAHSGGWARICASSIVPDASSFFGFARADRISLASRRARRRCSRDLPGTLAFALPADTRPSLGGRSSQTPNLLGWRSASRRQRVSRSVGNASGTVAHPRRPHRRGRLGEDLRQLDRAGREVFLQLRSRRPDLVCMLQGTRVLFTRSTRTLALAWPSAMRPILRAESARRPDTRTRGDLRCYEGVDPGSKERA